MKFEKTEVWGFEHAVRGMRNNFNSWDKSDSDCLFHMLPNFSEDDPNASNYEAWMDKFGFNYKIGEKDLELMKKLINAGSEHRKFLRQIIVSVDIEAPLYWWREFDTYKVGTVSNSCSTMHTLTKKPLTLDCFETPDFDSFDDMKEGMGDLFKESWINHLNVLELLRNAYEKSKDKRFWYQLIGLLPQSYLQKRTVTMNYENILSMVRQRKEHKLEQWSRDFMKWVETLPYANELLLGE